MSDAGIRVVGAGGGPAGAMPCAASARRGAGRTALWLAVVLLATGLTYGRCLGDYFVFDDYWHLAKANANHGLGLLRPWEYSGEDFRAYWFAESRMHDRHEPGYFRPAVTVVYAVGLRLWGPQPLPFHAVSVLAHLASTGVMFWLARRIFGRDGVAALAAAGFGLHPSHVEAVEWIAGNADALLGVFGLLTVAGFVEFRRRGNRPGWYVLALTCYVLALGCKETAVTLPLLLLAADWLVIGGPGRGAARPVRGWAWYVPVALLTAGYLAWRAPSALGVYTLNTGSNYMVSFASPLALPQIVLNFTFYALHFFLLYPVLPVNFPEQFGAHCWWLAGVSVAGLGLLGAGLARLARPGGRAAWFGMAWVALTLLPFCFVEPTQHLAHFPTAGFALLLAAVVAGLAGRMDAATWRYRVLRAVPVAGLALYALLSLAYGLAWGAVSATVEQTVRQFERATAGLPAGSEIYLVNLGQLAWQFERLPPLEHPERRHRIQVLTFDPAIFPAPLRAKLGPISRWVHHWFPDGRDARVTPRLESPRTLVVRIANGEFFDGLIERELPVAAARRLHDPIDAGAFIAQATARNQRGVTELTFQWKATATPPPRAFLLWTGETWQRLTPPEGWEGK